MSIKQDTLQTIGICLSAAAAMAALGYYAGHHTASSENETLKREIEQMMAAQNTKNVFTFLEDLKEYNENLFEFEAHIKKLAELTEERDKLANENIRLSEEISTHTSRITELAKSLETTTSDVKDLREKLAVKYTLSNDVSLAVGQSHTFANGLVTLGVQSLYSTRAVLTIFDKQEYLNVGEGYHFEIEDNRCRLILSGIARKSDENNGTFLLACERQD